MRKSSVMFKSSILMPPLTKTSTLHSATGSMKAEEPLWKENQGSWTFLIYTTGFLCCWWAGKWIQNFLQRLASFLSNKWDNTYNSTLSWLRCILTLSLLCSSIRCIRGTHSNQGYAVRQSPIDLVYKVRMETLLLTSLKFFIYPYFCFCILVYSLCFSLKESWHNNNMGYKSKYLTNITREL